MYFVAGSLGVERDGKHKPGGHKWVGKQIVKEILSGRVNINTITKIPTDGRATISSAVYRTEYPLPVGTTDAEGFVSRPRWRKSGFAIFLKR